MAQAQRYKLTLSKLDFISLVDDPAQPNATTLLIKRKGKADEVQAVAKFIGGDEELGLAWFWAFTSTEKSGEAHYDHHGDQVVADTEMVKAVLDYMKRGGAVDEMHDYEQKSRVVFAMPVTADVAKSIGIQQTGLLVTIKCTADQLEKLKDGTYTGVSIAGLGSRELVEACKSTGAVRKTVSLFTDEIDGHQHQIDIGDDGYTWCSWATSAGADTTHSHAIARDESGAIVILADSGHTHQLADGQPAVVVVPEGAVIVTEVAMRRIPTVKARSTAPHAGESPQPIAARSVKNNSQESTQMTTDAKTTDLEKQVVSLTKRAERAETVAKLTVAHKAHFESLAGTDADAFLAKNDIEKNQAIEAAEKSNPVEFELDGIAYRKTTQGYTLAKRIREQAEHIEKADIEKAATALVGDASAPGALVVAKAIRSIAKQEDREAAEKLLKQLVATSRIGKSAPGGDGEAVSGNDSATPLDALTKGLVDFCKAEKIDDKSMWTVGLPKFEKTDKGRDLKAAYDESAG